MARHAFSVGLILYALWNRIANKAEASRLVLELRLRLTVSSVGCAI